MWSKATLFQFNQYLALRFVSMIKVQGQWRFHQCQRNKTDSWPCLHPCKFEQGGTQTCKTFCLEINEIVLRNKNMKRNLCINKKSLFFFPPLPPHHLLLEARCSRQYALDSSLLVSSSPWEKKKIISSKSSHTCVSFCQIVEPSAVALKAAGGVCSWGARWRRENRMRGEEKKKEENMSNRYHDLHGPWAHCAPLATLGMRATNERDGRGGRQRRLKQSRVFQWASCSKEIECPV